MGEQRTSRAADLVSRSIYFYAANVGVNEQTGRLLPFDPAPILSHIDGMPLSGADRRLQLPDDRTAFCWIDSHDPPQKLRIANIRRSGLPTEELDGVLTPLEVRERAGLADPIHVVFFEDNIVGADYNFFGPRMAGLQNYLANKAPRWSENLKFGNLVDPDTERRLNRYEDLRVLDLKMRLGDAHVLRHYHRGLAGSFDSANEYLDEDAQFEVIIRPKANSRKRGIGGGFFQAVKGMFVNATVRDRATKFKVTGIDDSGTTGDEINLLSDDLVLRKVLLKQDSRTRVVAADSAYEAIIEAHQEVHHKLSRASSLYVLRSESGQDD